MATGIILNQTLHGYADGHQLLAASVDLTSEEQALLLFMSDLSGPAFRSGFESYLTGYPLQRSGQYCFARTWFAPEMARPGCVWTHTFLIRGEDLPRIQKLERLNLYFKRPQSPEDTRQYRDRLSFKEEPTDAQPSPWADARPMLAALYGTDRQIVVPSENSKSHEELCLAMYDQQWPRLRRNFRFCTGALSWRESEFDLSVCPPEETHSIGGKAIVIEEAREATRSFESWVDVANVDLSAGPGSEYRKFLWQFGSDYSEGRAAFRPLTEIFELLAVPANSEPIGEKLLSAVAHFFPQPENGRRLKAELFGKEGRFQSQIGGNKDLTKILVTHPSAAAIGDEVAAIHDRSDELIKSNMEEATELALLATQLGGRNAQTYLDAYFDHALRSEAVLRKTPSTLLFDILERQPALMANPVLWTRLDHVGLINRAIARLAANPTLLKEAISSMIAAKAWDALASAVDQFGNPALSQIFAVVESESTSVIDYPDALYAIMWSRQHNVVEMLERGQVGDIAVKMLSAEIDPRSWTIRRVDLARWQRVTETPAAFVDERRTLMSAIFLLSLGLSGGRRGEVSLVSASFPVVYESAAAKMLNNALWERLEPVLAWYSPDWDKCARLIRTVARAFKDREWSARHFAKTFATNDQFSRALGEIDELYRGDRYIRRLKGEGKETGIKWSSSQLSAFKNFV